MVSSTTIGLLTNSSLGRTMALLREGTATETVKATSKLFTHDSLKSIISYLGNVAIHSDTSHTLAGVGIDIATVAVIVGGVALLAKGASKRNRPSMTHR